MAQNHSAQKSGRIVSLRGHSVPDVSGTGRGRNHTGWSGAADRIGRGGIPWHVRRHLAVHRGGVMPDAGLYRPLQPRLLRAERIDTQHHENRAFPSHRHQRGVHTVVFTASRGPRGHRPCARAADPREPFHTTLDVVGHRQKTPITRQQGADVFLGVNHAANPWLSRFYRTHPTKRLLDVIVVAPVGVPVDQREHLPTGVLLPPPGSDGPDPHPAEETLRGRVVRRTALRARRSRQPEPLHEFQPSRPPMVTATVGTHPRTRALGQRGGRLLRHGVGGLHVGAVSGCVGDYLAVVAVDHRREIHLAIRRLDLGDVRQPLLVGTFGGEVPGDRGAGGGIRPALVGTVPATSGNMRHGPVLGHDPSGHLLRDAGSESGLDPAVPVTTLGRGERIGRLRSEPGVFILAGLRMVAVVASGRDGEQAELRRGLDGRIHRHAGRVHGLVSGQEDQDGVRTRASWTVDTSSVLWHDW